MTLRHLTIFNAVVDAGGMNKAAKILHLSQPNISQAIAELEQHFGVRLFERLSQRLYLTKEGELLLSFSRHILDSYKQMEEMEIISPVLSIAVEYHSMVHFDDTVVIQTKLVKYNGIKMEVEYVMTDKETGELRTTARSSHCFLNRSGKPISLKRSYPELDTKFFEMKEDMQ